MDEAERPIGPAHLFQDDRAHSVRRLFTGNQKIRRQLTAVIRVTASGRSQKPVSRQYELSARLTRTRLLERVTLDFLSVETTRLAVGL